VTRFITLAEYLWPAEQVTGGDAATVARTARIDLADSALHAPQAGCGDAKYYPDLYDKAAVLLCRLTWNHPLVDGYKRAA
jgi:death-on-curing protein